MVKSVKADFNAKGDGITDDTVALNNAALYSSLSRESVFIDAGVYIHSGLTVYPYTRLYGEGRLTRLQLIAGCNNDSIKGVNSDLWWGMTSHSTPTNTCYYVEISDIVIDGGVTNFQEGNVGSGIAIWGSRLRIHNVDIENCAEHGIHTDYYDNNYDASLPWYESSFYSIRIFNCGKHGWLCAGPHDLHATDVTIIDGSRNGNALYDGLYVTPNCSANFVNLHVSNAMSQTIRHRYAGNIEGPCRFSGGTTFEGSRDCVHIASNHVQFDDSCTSYIPWGDGVKGTVMCIESGVSFCRIRGTLSGAGAFKTQTNWGIRFLPGNGSVSHNDIDVTIDGCQIPISFGSSTTAPDADGGKNRIRIIAYYADGLGTIAPSTYGIPNTANGTILDLQFSGNVNSRYLSERQSSIFNIAAGGSVTWTYKYPFVIGPVITLAIKGPSSLPANGVWVTGSSATNATIFNGTGQPIVLHATAQVLTN